MDFSKMMQQMMSKPRSEGEKKMEFDFQEHYTKNRDTIQQQMQERMEAMLNDRKTRLSRWLNGDRLDTDEEIAELTGGLTAAQIDDFAELFNMYIPIYHTLDHYIQFYSKSKEYENIKQHLDDYRQLIKDSCHQQDSVHDNPLPYYRDEIRSHISQFMLRVWGDTPRLNLPKNHKVGGYYLTTCYNVEKLIDCLSHNFFSEKSWGEICQRVDVPESLFKLKQFQWYVINCLNSPIYLQYYEDEKTLLNSYREYLEQLTIQFSGISSSLKEGKILLDLVDIEVYRVDRIFGTGVYTKVVFDIQSNQTTVDDTSTDAFTEYTLVEQYTTLGGIESDDPKYNVYFRAAVLGDDVLEPRDVRFRDSNGRVATWNY